MEPVHKRAKDVEIFLTKLYEEVVAHSQFESLYVGDVGDAETELRKLLVALRTNRENLVSTTREAEMFPHDLLLQSQANGYRRGLEATLAQAEALWARIRSSLEQGTSELTQKVEKGEVQAKEHVGSKSVSNKVLDALKKVKEALAASLDVAKVAVEYLPLILTIREALDSLKLLN
jgi:hypothetical protein